MLNTTFEKVMICFSHCHSAPNADVIPEYYEMVCRKIEVAAKDAAEKSEEVSIGWGNAEVEIGVNRRKGNNNLDKRAGILKVCSGRSDVVKLLILRLTAHCNALKRDNYMISPDFFGAIREKLKERYNCPVIGIDGTKWLKEIRRLNDSGIEMQEEKVEVQYLKIGKWCLCGVPYELMVEFALKAQEKLKDEFFYLNGYTMAVHPISLQRKNLIREDMKYIGRCCYIIHILTGSFH